MKTWCLIPAEYTGISKPRHIYPAIYTHSLIPLRTRTSKCYPPKVIVVTTRCHCRPPASQPRRPSAPASCQPRTSPHRLLNQLHSSDDISVLTGHAAAYPPLPPRRDAPSLPPGPPHPPCSPPLPMAHLHTLRGSLNPTGVPRGASPRLQSGCDEHPAESYSSIIHTRTYVHPGKKAAVPRRGC